MGNSGTWAGENFVGYSISTIDSSQQNPGESLAFSRVIVETMRFYSEEYFRIVSEMALFHNEPKLTKPCALSEGLEALERRLSDRTLYLRNRESTGLRRTLFPPQNQGM